MSDPWVAIQRNPRSGSGRRRRPLLELIAALKRRGLRPRMFRNRERMHAVVTDPDRRASLVCIVAAGGDGTIGDVINRCPDIPVCPFPLGTENVLCRYLGIPRCGETVAELIAAGQPQRLDLGSSGDRRFLLMASAGFDAEVIHRLHDRRRGNISHFNYAKPILQTAFGYAYPELRVTIDNQPELIRGSLVVVANVPAYAFRLPITPDARPDSGRFSVCVFHKPGTIQLLRYWNLVRRQAHLNRDDVTTCEASTVRIESDQPVSMQMDGDPSGATPCELSVLPRAMKIFAP